VALKDDFVEMFGRLGELDAGRFQSNTSGAPFVLSENDTNVEMRCDLTCCGDSILLKLDESWDIAWLKNKRRADYAVFELKGSMLIVHIFELKRTINSKTWKNMKEQFEGAYLRIGAITGVLGKRASKIRLYSCYINDNLASISITKRAALSNQRILKSYKSWKSPKIILNYSVGNVTCTHTKIPLNKSGVGSYQL